MAYQKHLIAYVAANFYHSDSHENRVYHHDLQEPWLPFGDQGISLLQQPETITFCTDEANTPYSHQAVTSNCSILVPVNCSTWLAVPMYLQHHTIRSAHQFEELIIIHGTETLQILKNIDLLQLTNSNLWWCWVGRWRKARRTSLSIVWMEHLPLCSPIWINSKDKKKIYEVQICILLTHSMWILVWSDDKKWSIFFLMISYSLLDSDILEVPTRVADAKSQRRLSLCYYSSALE